MPPRAKHFLRALCALAACLPGFALPARAQIIRGEDTRISLLANVDRNGDGWLNSSERRIARAYLGNTMRNFGTPLQWPGTPGPKILQSSVKSYGKESLYDPTTLRTIFLEFEEGDWEQELEDFYHTDVRVPARLTMDGKVYQGVGVSFRGHSSYATVSVGRKRSFDLSMDLVNEGQDLLGYKALNLLNANADPTFMRNFLYYHVARQYTAAPKANFVRVVINGESWGIYVNVQQLSGDFARDNFNTSKGARWKVPSTARGSGGLTYLGESLSSYKSAYQIKSKDDPKSWAELRNLCKVLNTTPADRLEKALEPILDVEGALKFLAVDKALQNGDGYWTRSSDYGLYEDPSGKFHVIPWDANETWREFTGKGVTLDPYAGATEPAKALLYRLLEVPAYDKLYLGYLRDIAENWLDWKKLGPIVQEMQALIAADVKTDTRKIYSTAAFTGAVTIDGFEPVAGRSSTPYYSLKSFADQRRSYLLNYPDIKALSRK